MAIRIDVDSADSLYVLIHKAIMGDRVWPEHATDDELLLRRASENVRQLILKPDFVDDLAFEDDSHWQDDIAC
jgi:hypothetical protein